LSESALFGSVSASGAAGCARLCDEAAAGDGLPAPRASTKTRSAGIMDVKRMNMCGVPDDRQFGSAFWIRSTMMCA
jgi:hypothetical protein